MKIMEPNIIYIVYYTKGNYEKVFKEKLLPSLIRWKLPFDVVIFDNKFTWAQATRFKAQVCKDMLLKHKKPIVYIDVDATVEQDPVLFNKLGDFDIAYHSLDWYLFWKQQKGSPKRETLSGTLYLNYNKKILQFLDEWIKMNSKCAHLEQLNMGNILKEKKSLLKIYELPASYCTIINKDNSIPYWYIKKEDIVILHWQASRKYKYNTKI